MRTMPEARSVPSWLIPSLLALAAIVWVATWGGHYPANMTPDSIAQWDQVQRNDYHDWHPVAHTLLIKAMSCLWASPAPMILLHIIVMLVLLHGILKETRALVPSTLAVGAVGAFYALHPIHGTMLSSLVKDTAFSLAIVAFSLALFRIVRNSNTPTNGHIALLTGSGLAVVLLRHQGIAVVTLSLAALSCLPKARRVGLVILLFLFGAAFAWKLALRQVWQIPGSPITEALAIPLQQTTVITSQDGRITPTQKTLIETVAPWKVWTNPQSLRSVDWLKFDPAFSPVSIQQDPAVYAHEWWKLVQANPGLATRAVLSQTDVIWNPMTDADYVHLNGVTPNSLGLSQKPWSLFFSRIANHSGRLLSHPPVSWSVRPALLHLVLAGAAFVAIKRGGVSGLIPFLPVAILLATLAVLIPTPDFRYFYPIYLSAPLLLVHAFTIPLGKKNALVPSDSSAIPVT